MQDEIAHKARGASSPPLEQKWDEFMELDTGIGPEDYEPPGSRIILRAATPVADARGKYAGKTSRQATRDEKDVCWVLILYICLL